MIKSMKLKLSGGEFEIERGVDFFVSSATLAHLIYEKNGVWHIESDPCKGKYAKTVITLPYQHTFSDIHIEISDGTLKLCSICCESIEFKVKEAAIDTDVVTAQNLYLQMTRSNIHIKADSVLTDIDCGYGTADIKLNNYSYGYKIISKCGVGNVTLNSVLLPKKYISGNGERRINVVCGMGDVNINFIA